MPDWIEPVAAFFERVGLAPFILLFLLIGGSLAAVGIWKAGWPFLVKQVERVQARKDKEQAEAAEARIKQTMALEQLGSALEEVGRQVQVGRTEQQTQGREIADAMTRTSAALGDQLVYIRQFNEDILAIRRDLTRKK